MKVAKRSLHQLSDRVNCLFSVHSVTRAPTVTRAPSEDAGLEDQHQHRGPGGLSRGQKNLLSSPFKKSQLERNASVKLVPVSQDLISGSEPAERRGSQQLHVCF